MSATTFKAIVCQNCLKANTIKRIFKVCPSCQSKDLLPLDSPRARELLGDGYDQAVADAQEKQQQLEAEREAGAGGRKLQVIIAGIVIALILVAIFVLMALGIIDP